MSGIFLSYSRADRALADQVVRGLRALDVDVWWDEDMPGVDWQDELARQINELAAVIVLWTPASTASKNVKDEARLGQHTEKLVNALCGVSAPPFPFDRVNGLPLDGWTGREPHRGWTRLVKTVEDHLAQSGLAKPGELSGALAAREHAIHAMQQQVAAAEEAYQLAKADEEAAASASADAHAALAAAEEVLRRVVEVRAGGAVLRAANADVDAAQSAQTEAATARKTAAAALARAARAMTRARADLDRLFDDGRTSAPAGAVALQPPPPPPALTEPSGPALAAEPPEAPAAAATPALAEPSAPIAATEPPEPPPVATAAITPPSAELPMAIVAAEPPAPLPAATDPAFAVPATAAERAPLDAGALAPRSTVARAWKLLLGPVHEWQVIEQETSSAQSVFLSYACVLALIPVAASIVTGLIAVLIAHVPALLIAAAAGAAVNYVVSLAAILALGFFINAVASAFGAQSNPTKAMKVAVYGMTAVWVAGAFGFLPLLSLAIGFAGFCYSCVLVYLGVVRLLKPPASGAVAAAAISVVIFVALLATTWVILFVLAAMLYAAGGMDAGVAPTVAS